MNNYKFEIDHLALSDTGIHLLRSRFNYDTINFLTITNIKIKRGRQIKNWLLAMMIGLLLLAFGIFTGFKVVYEFFFANNFHRFYIEQLLIPFFPIVAGSYLIYNALKIGYILEILIDNKVKRFPIEEINKNGALNELKLFFKKNTLTSLKFEDL
jgi:hypothetical protein